MQFQAEIGILAINLGQPAGIITRGLFVSCPQSSLDPAAPAPAEADQSVLIFCQRCPVQAAGGQMFPLRTGLNE